MVVYYLAENRVDFRELVRLLAAEFQTRIEMRQIGVRDEAKLLADYGDCGKPTCCNSHLRQCRRSRCGWPRCKRRPWTPRRFPAAADA